MKKKVIWCKLLYALFTPIENMKLIWSGVDTNGLVFSGGRLFVSKAKDSAMRIGKNCRFMSKSWGNSIGLNHICMLTVESKANLSIGNNCSFSGDSIWCFESITIGSHVRVGANCLIMDGDAHQDDPRAGKNKPIVIEDNVWLGGNVVVKKGVTIGRNSVIGMNSVVTKNIPANCVAIGNPCVVIRYFDETKIKEIERYFA